MLLAAALPACDAKPQSGAGEASDMAGEQADKSSSLRAAAPTPLVAALAAPPAPGNPFADPMLAPTDQEGKQTNGARFGCSRAAGTQYHGGLDLKAKDGTPVAATYAGKVQAIRTSVPNDKNTPGSVGNFVIVDTKAAGVAIKYCHLSKVSVKAGEKVVQGQLLGLTGRSGNAYNAAWPHLHLEASSDFFQTDKQYVDPELHIKKQFSPPNPNKKACE